MIDIQPYLGRLNDLRVWIYSGIDAKVYNIWVLNFYRQTGMIPFTNKIEQIRTYETIKG